MTSGTPNDARRHQAWFSERGARYVDVANLAGPATIGTESALIFCSGDRTVYERREPMLKFLAGGATFLDEAVGAAATLECALLSLYTATSLAALQGAAMCEAEGFPVDRFLSAANGWLPMFPNTIRQACERAVSGDYIDNSGAGASIAAHHAGSVHLARLSRDAGISSMLPDLVVHMYAAAIEAGHADSEKEAVFEILRHRHS